MNIIYLCFTSKTNMKSDYVARLSVSGKTMSAETAICVIKWMTFPICFSIVLR